jgi:SAM-dependent MidA family methyltransferase
MRSFRDFMEEKVRAYYTREGPKIGPLGDFFTAPELDRSFGRAVAEFLLPFLREFERPALLEMGAGRGLMARDILEYLKEKDPEVFGKLTYYIYEISEPLRRIQERVLAGMPVVWVDRLPLLEGVVLSNEFFDTLPVHVVKNGRELYVSDSGEEVWLELRNPKVGEFLRRMGYEGLDQRVEVCLDCVDLLRRIAESLVRGYHLVIDYGYTSEEIGRFPEGTVLGYKRHRVTDDIYSEEMDLSAHVNFSALMEYGEDFGLRTVFLQTQREFLMSVPGFLEELERLSLEGSPEAVERLSRMKTLLVSMGDRFKVLFQRKGL